MSFVGGTRCSWCAGKKIHPLDSFAQYNINRMGVDFLEKYWCEDNIVNPWSIKPFANNTQIHIQCQHKEYHQYWVDAADYSLGVDCPFCNRSRLHINDSFGTKFPNVVNIWSDKNTKSPFTYHLHSHQSVWFKCENGDHDDYPRRISQSITKDGKLRLCPDCVRQRRESFMQEQVRLWLQKTQYDIYHEYECSIVPVNPYTKQKMPFDNEVVDICGHNLIVETHGPQHYELNGWHILRANQRGITPEEELEYQKWKDNFKKEYAISRGYDYLAIPYWTIYDGTYKNLITNKINQINKQYYKNA